MSLSPYSEDLQSLWQGVIQAESALRDRLRALFSVAAQDRLELIRQSLRTPGNERMLAMRVLPYLSLADRQALFPDLVWLASWGHGLVQEARNAILSLPRAWVLARIEKVADPLLMASSEQNQFEEYRRLLELYQQLGNPELVRRLASLAVQHADEDVHEAGHDFLAIQARD